MKATPAALRSADQLAAVVGAGTLPTGVQDLGRRVLERVSSPVRIAVLGAPDAGLAGVVNAVLEGDIVPDRSGMPPLDLSFGLDPAIRVVTAEGQESAVDLATFARLVPWDLAMVSLAAPVPLLEKASFLLVPLEGRMPDIEAAIAWAARRADMAVLCTTEPGAAGAGVEGQEILERLPEALVDHTFLAVTGTVAMRTGGGDSLAVELDPEAQVRGLHWIGDGAGQAQRLAQFRADLFDHVSTARREDLESALVFLDRYRAVPEVGPATTPEPQDAGLETKAPATDVAPGVDAARPDPVTDAQSRAPAEIVCFLSARAEALSRLCDVPGGDALEAAAPDVLAHCMESIETCAGMATEDCGAAGLVLAEASDLMLLMQLEATADAVCDAVALVLQVRNDCESLLCA
ncbi:hypothetical protein CLV78_101514 [Aliiruegeria haliotis]|uniref:Uncharacterized protein n=1 Tax=Aliiruegeria haliotis TaxID=1280846 RepID=A0A2T0RZ08_9RHOB|nr:hypothetical protein [Aliiruegeria haliotis]PRY26419.1 hypothetical protein CLV78_101514 [Aliiruegeria haliotis]